MVEDQTDPGASNATKKLNAFDKAVQQAKDRLDKMNRSKFQVALEAIDKVSSVVGTITGAVNGLAGKAWRVTMSVFDKATAPIRKITSALGDMLGISTAVSTVLAGLTVKNALQASADMVRMQTQLKVSATNMGIDESGIENIMQKATSLSKTTMYTDEAMVGAAAELATYFDDVDAITRMMDTVVDYASGMSGGVELSTEEIIDYTTNLAKMTTGAYDAMTKKGFEVTEAQKAILESGTDMEKVAVIEEIIKENWEGMAEAMANTPTGILTKLKNKWGEISGIVGDKLTPGFTKLYSMFFKKMPAVEELITQAANKLGAWIEDFVPNLETFIDKGITKIKNFGNAVSDMMSGEDWANADIWGKLKIAWDKIVAESFGEWWSSSGKTKITGFMGDLGKTIGSGITAGLLALMGIDTGGVISDGKAIGASFIEGFRDGFDTEQITVALKDWASEHKGTVAALGLMLGGKLIGGVASGVKKAQGFIGTIQGILGKGSGVAGAIGSSYSVATMSVTAGVVNLSAGGLGNAAGRAAANAASGGLPALPGAAGSNLPALSGGTAGAAAAGGLTSATGWLGKFLQLGSSSSVIGADGTLLAVNGGVGGVLGGVGGALGSGATTAAGAAAAGTAAIGGGLLGGAGIISGLIDIFRGIQTNGKEAQTAYATGGSKIGMVGAGAAAGAAIGSVVPVIGTGVGALVGAGLGGLGALGFGDKIGQALSDALDEGGWLNNMGVAISGFFTETLPTKWGEFWDGVGNFFTETVPYALGFAAGKVTMFFTETLPTKWGEFWTGVGNFFTESIPAWWENVKAGAATFFTETLPTKWTEFWTGIGNFFTETIPTWIDNSLTSAKTFFTETLPEKWNSFWGGIGEKISGFFGGVWDNIKGAFSSGYSDATAPTPHAWGGIMTKPHMGIVAEAGAESIIPLSPSKRGRGIDLWEQTGQALGVRPYADGGIVGETEDTEVPITPGGGSGGAPAKIDIHLQMSPSFVVEARESGMDENTIIAIIKAHIKEMVDDISDELAERLARVFANMPVRGGA